MRPLNRKILRDLWRLRGQASAIALIVASGVAVLVMSLSAMQALTDTAGAYYERYRFADVFANAKRAPLLIARRIGDIDGVQTVEARIVRYATLDVRNFNEPIIGSIVSIPVDRPAQLNQLVLRQGRYPAPNKPFEVIIGEPFAEAHRLELGDRFEALLNGRKRPLDIVGIALSPEFVYSIGPGALMPDAARYGVIWMSNDALEAAFDLENAFNDLAITVWPDAHVPSVLEHIDTILEPYGGAGAYARKDQISNWFVMNEIEQLKSIASILPPIFLAVAAFLTNMVLVRLVFIERAEIGLIKAFGYSHATMAWHYTKLVLAISMAGVAIGWAFGLWLGHWMTGMYADLFRFPLIIFAPDYEIYLVSAGISIGAALIGAIAAARIAASLPPAEAMRPPSPPAFRHRGFSLRKLIRRLDQPTRIIFRQLLRRPLRTLITSTGVAASVAVLVASMQWLDAIDFMIEDFFNAQQRQDMTIGLVEAGPTQIIHDAARLPGVQAVEPQRAVAARLRFGHRYRREAVVGLPSDGGLHVLHDTRGSPVSVPGAGLLVSSSMAGLLDLEVGDTVIVEVLEGRRPVVPIPVAAIFETLIGTPVYMDLDALNRALKEPERTNTLAVVFDERVQTRLFEELKALPSVAGVVLKRAAIDLFDQTIGETMLIVIIFYTGFASVLSFGVIYNNMRISLSERGRELATLRVMGFRNGEIAYMLFGEAAMLTLLGLPLGCFLGWLLAEFMALGFNTELFRIPVVIEPSTYGYGVLVVLGSAVASALLVELRLKRLDLIAVLKTRE